MSKRYKGEKNVIFKIFNDVEKSFVDIFCLNRNVITLMERKVRKNPRHLFEFFFLFFCWNFAEEGKSLKMSLHFCRFEWIKKRQSCQILQLSDVSFSDAAQHLKPSRNPTSTAYLTQNFGIKNALDGLKQSELLMEITGTLKIGTECVVNTLRVEIIHKVCGTKIMFQLKIW